MVKVRDGAYNGVGQWLARIAHRQTGRASFHAWHAAHQNVEQGLIRFGWPPGEAIGKRDDGVGDVSKVDWGRYEAEPFGHGTGFRAAAQHDPTILSGKLADAACVAERFRKW